MSNSYKDPICGMDVSPHKAAGTSKYQGTLYYSCSLGCLQTFEQQPAKYAIQPVAEHAHGSC